MFGQKVGKKSQDIGKKWIVYNSNYNKSSAKPLQ